MKKRKQKDVFTKAGFTQKNYEVIALIIGVVAATSSDAGTKLKCTIALRNFRKLRRIVKGPAK